MKILQNLFLIVVLAMASTSPIVGQIGTLGAIENDSEGGGTRIPITLTNCTAYFPVTIYLTNLDGVSVNYEIPSDRPEMYLEYSIEDIATGYIPLTEFSLHTQNIFSKNVIIGPIDFSTQCTRSTGDVPFDLSLRLVSPRGGGGYGNYPACNYTASDDIFSCEVFLNAGDCVDPLRSDDDNARTDEEPNGATCQLHKLIKKKYLYKGTCPSSCVYEDGPSDTGGGRSISNPNQNVSVYPNPTNGLLNIQWPADQDVEGITLYRLDGSMLKAWNKNQLEGKTTFETSVDFLSQGIYLLEVRTSDTSQVVKVVKQ